jgi:hypothetical protein
MSLDLTPGDLREIDEVSRSFEVEGARYPDSFMAFPAAQSRSGMLVAPGARALRRPQCRRRPRRVSRRAAAAKMRRARPTWRAPPCRARLRQAQRAPHCRRPKQARPGRRDEGRGGLTARTDNDPYKPQQNQPQQQDDGKRRPSPPPPSKSPRIKWPKWPGLASSGRDRLLDAHRHRRRGPRGKRQGLRGLRCHSLFAPV